MSWKILLSRKSGNGLPLPSSLASFSLIGDSCESLGLVWRVSRYVQLLDSSLVNSSTLEDKVTGGGRLSGIDVADNDDVDV